MKIFFYGGNMKFVFGTIFEKIIMGSKRSNGSITAIPIKFELTKLDYVSLESAINEGLAEITEVDKSGSVPELRFINKSEKMIFIWDGEELRGGKQNRVANTSILVNANTTLDIPVSCIEQGRWNFKDQKFKTSKYSIPMEIRKQKNSSVTEHLKYNKRFSSNQGEVWDNIEKFAGNNNAKSKTMAVSDLMESRVEEIEEKIKDFELLEGQNGILIAVNNEVVGLEYISNKKVFSDLFRRILMAYSSDNLGEENSEPDDDKLKCSMNDFLDGIKSTMESEFSAVGIGKEKRLENSKFEAICLEYQDELVYFSAFRK
jgi:hypothetical protein